MSRTAVLIDLVVLVSQNCLADITADLQDVLVLCKHGCGSGDRRRRYSVLLSVSQAAGLARTDRQETTCRSLCYLLTSAGQRCVNADDAQILRIAYRNRGLCLSRTQGHYTQIKQKPPV